MTGMQLIPESSSLRNRFFEYINDVQVGSPLPTVECGDDIHLLRWRLQSEDTLDFPLKIEDHIDPDVNDDGSEYESNRFKTKVVFTSNSLHQRVLALSHFSLGMEAEYVGFRIGHGHQVYT